MGKRYLNCTASDILKMDSAQLIDAIAGSEGRLLVCETIGAVRPMLGDVTNAEFACAMGADLLILNLFDVNKPEVQGLPETAPEDVVREVKWLTGRAVGINLEPLEEDVESSVETNGEWHLTSGRAATVENARKAIDMGVDFIVLTGNPGVGVTNAAIIHTLRKFRQEFGDRVMLIAGKMHAAGVLAESGENIITEEDVRAFIGAGADVVLMPADGHRHIPGRGGHIDDPRDRPDVQDDRDGPSSSGRFRVSWHGPSGEYPGIRESDPGCAAYVSPDGVVP